MNNIIVHFVPSCYGCQSRAGKPRKWMEEKPVERQSYKVCWNGGNQVYSRYLIRKCLHCVAAVVIDHLAADCSMITYTHDEIQQSAVDEGKIWVV